MIPDFLLSNVVHPCKAQTENIDRANHDVMVRFGAAACGTGGVIFFVRVWANDPLPDRAPVTHAAAIARAVETLPRGKTGEHQSDQRAGSACRTRLG
jgi:hypothetical protein